MSEANQIRINELARELEIKAKVLIEYLPEIGVTEKKTHSSSIDVDHAELVRKHFRQLADAEAAAEAAKSAAKPKPRPVVAPISASPAPARPIAPAPGIPPARPAAPSTGAPPPSFEFGQCPRRQCRLLRLAALVLHQPKPVLPLPHPRARSGCAQSTRARS